MQDITLFNLANAFIPVMIVIAIFWYWSLEAGQAIYAVSRMLMQLLLIGYVLVFIFETKHSGIVLSVLFVMIMASSWIALRTVKENRGTLFWYALVSILSGGVFTLVIMTLLVLQVEPWFQPKTMIPLAGMIFSNSMTSISLAVERLYTEIDRDMPYTQARGIALRTALIPVMNSMFAVGLVALPGMMTGQILSGVSPMIAVRYQIMVMCMLFGGAGISTTIFLVLVKNQFLSNSES